jgi:hypothetical protein
MMLTLKQLLRQTSSHKQKLFANASNVAVALNKASHGKDARGYYRAVTGSARTAAKDKKTKRIEFRFYYPKGRSHKDTYIPPDFRDKNKPYVGPMNPPLLTLDTKVWVFCTCEWYLFNAEVANAESDNSSINYRRRDIWTTKNGKPLHITNNNGKAPVITNPNHVQHCCKHLIAGVRAGALKQK